MVVELVPELLEAKGFENVESSRQGGMKFVDAERLGGGQVRFWVKQAWSTTNRYSAVQFGMLPGPNAGVRPDSDFVDLVQNLVMSAKERGATHAFLVHMYQEQVLDYVALEIDDLARAYVRQISGWPARARNTKSPTIWFGDTRPRLDAACVMAVLDLEIPIEVIAGIESVPVGGPGGKKVTALIERRLQQRAFRFRVAALRGWRCAVSGVEVREVLDAAHLPGRSWRDHNQGSDGILLRSDLHRLLDRDLAELTGGHFLVKPEARLGEYAKYHGCSVAAMLD